MFQGDIAQFAPVDLLLFLSHMNKEGVLSVRRGDETLSVSFRRNLVVDAESEAAERLIMDQLQQSGAFSGPALAYLRQAREETGLPLVRILEQGDQSARREISAAMALGLRETLFRLLLWEQGQFQFTEMPVDDNPHVPGQDGQALVLDLTREVDEYRELMRGLGDLSRPGFAAARPDEATKEEAYVLSQAGECATVAGLIDTAPFPRLSTAWAVAAAVDNGWLSLATEDAEAITTTDDEGPLTGVMPAYRRSLRRMLQTDDRKQHLREVLEFAQARCSQTILLAVSGDRLRRATVYRRDATGRLTASDHRDPSVELAVDMVFHQALTSRRPFVGDMFPSPILDALDAGCEASACALLPLGAMGQYDLLMHAASTEPNHDTGPLTCLEMLAWQMTPPETDAAQAAEVNPEPDESAYQADDDEAAADALVASIKDLPPMPAVAARVLQLLGEADLDMNQLTEALSHDPALVARLIKVSNSSLYGGLQQVSSIDQAIVRLGNRTVRSVVVTASTRSLFPTDNNRVGMMGRELWQHAVVTGLASRRVAEFTRRADADEAFTAGILHDLGKVLILLNHADEYAELLQKLQHDGGDSVWAERECLGFDHCLVAERLLQNWGLPENLCLAARWHHEPMGAGDHRDLATVVSCGDLLGHARGGDVAPDSWLQRKLDPVCAELELDHGARCDLLEFLALDLEQCDLLD